MGHLLFGVNSFFRFASKNRTSMLPFSASRRAVLRRGTNYSKAWFCNARGGKQNSLDCAWRPAQTLAG